LRLRFPGDDEDPPQLCQPRFYDFNVYTSKKWKEKLDYMHTNPVERKLVRNPGEWVWSSFWFYENGAPGLIPIDPGD